MKAILFQLCSQWNRIIGIQNEEKAGNEEKIEGSAHDSDSDSHIEEIIIDTINDNSADLDVDEL